MSKLNTKLFELNELHDINRKIVPLKEIADRELASIYGLSGMVYTPHIDEYMQVCIKRAEILACLKKQKKLPLSVVEITNSALTLLHNRVKNNTVVEYNGNNYQRRFLPLKLSKSGKNVQKWAKFWLLLTPDGKPEHDWERQVKEIWPSYFLIRNIGI